MLGSQGRVQGPCSRDQAGCPPTEPLSGGITRSEVQLPGWDPGRLGLCLLSEIPVLAYCQVGLPVKFSASRSLLDRLFATKWILL